jgi:hypothetical protein
VNILFAIVLSNYWVPCPRFSFFFFNMSHYSFFFFLNVSFVIKCKIHESIINFIYCSISRT